MSVQPAIILGDPRTGYGSDPLRIFAGKFNHHVHSEIADQGTIPLHMNLSIFQDGKIPICFVPWQCRLVSVALLLMSGTSATCRLGVQNLEVGPALNLSLANNNLESFVYPMLDNPVELGVQDLLYLKASNLVEPITLHITAAVLIGAPPVDPVGDL